MASEATADGDARVANGKALVTGAAGFMGKYMVDILLEEGIDVLATDIGMADSQALVGRSIYRSKPCDLTKKEDVLGLLLGEQFDYVFHIAALFDYSAPREKLFEVNVGGSLNLLNGLAAAGCKPQRLVMWGAAGVYDFTKEAPAKETSPVNPQGGYLESKFEAEARMFHEGARLGIPVSSLRPGGVYGPRSRYGVATSIFMAARGGMGPFYFGPGSTRAGMVHAEDVCRAGLFIARKPEAAGEIYNVNDDSSYKTSYLMRVAAKRLGFPLIAGNFPLAIMNFFVNNLGKKAAKKNRISIINPEMTALVAFDALLDPGKLKALGWKPKYPDSIAGLMATIDWYEREGWL